MKLIIKKPSKYLMVFSENKLFLFFNEEIPVDHDNGP